MDKQQPFCMKRMLQRVRSCSSCFALCRHKSDIGRKGRLKDDIIDEFLPGTVAEKSAVRRMYFEIKAIEKDKHPDFELQQLAIEVDISK
eukprot:CAMPEP_0196806870 /NCGR_PEP_ID=MMETSP1362-20130617/6808_1 /TAXON_ID=163516 /ORGANISM="Leptocylindrus danicus, Strain CCMP1856" /LENGTH=88 /DNA_ID=CAMNT_0042180551 /DNA_START=265 /DNA_END=531 /DNA_ORIENTATION=+